MATESFSSGPETMDDKIARLRVRAKELRADIKTHISTLASAYVPEEFPPDIRDAISQHQAHIQENLWRIGAGVTAFRVQDPDPRAVDGGSVLGIRFEIMRSGRFLQPYVVLLNRPYGAKGDAEAEESIAKTCLRVHRHTIPNCIPLSGLAARYLPPPTVGDSGDEEAPGKQRKQNLSLFVKELRQRLVAYHNRLGAVADMRRAAGLAADEKKRKRKREEPGPSAEQERGSAGEEAGQDDGGEADGPPRIVEISLADAEAKQIKIDWSNGDVCRLVIEDGGKIEKCVMSTARGRDMPAARDFLERVSRVEKLPELIQRKRGLEPT